MIKYLLSSLLDSAYLQITNSLIGENMDVNKEIGARLKNSLNLPPTVNKSWAMVLATQLKSLIKSKSITVAGLSKQTGIPAKTLYSWLQNQSPRNLNQLKSVADYFGVTLEFLLFNEQPKKEINSFEHYSEEINAGQFEVILRKIKK